MFFKELGIERKGISRRKQSLCVSWSTEAEHCKVFIRLSNWKLFGDFYE